MADDENPYSQFATPAAAPTQQPQAVNPYAQFAKAPENPYTQFATLQDTTKKAPMAPMPAAVVPGPSITGISASHPAFNLNAVPGFVDNMGKDWNEIKEGTPVAGSFIKQIYLDSIMPAGLRDTQLLNHFTESPQKFAEAITPKGPISAGHDWNTFGKIGEEVLKGYGQNYGPLWQGIGTPNYHPEDIGSHIYTHPSMLFDILPLAGKGLKLAGELPVAAKASGALSEAAKQVAHAIPVVGPYLKNEADFQGTLKAMRDVSQSFTAEHLPDVHAAQDAYAAAEKAVLAKGWNPADIIPAGEMRSVKLGVRFRTLPEVRAFYDIVNAQRDPLANKVMLKGGFSEEAFMQGKYGPYAVARFGDASPHNLALAKMDLDAAGINPPFFNIKHVNETARLNNLQKSIWGHSAIGRKLAGNDEEKLWKFQYDRTANEGAGNRDVAGTAKHALDVHVAGFLEQQLWLNLNELFEKLLNHPSLPKHGGHEVHLEQAMQQMAQRAGMTPEDAARWAKNAGATAIKLPEKLAEFMNDQLGVGPSKLGFWDKLTNFQKSAMLGMNPNWAASQTIQNVMTLPFTTFDSPKDIPRSILAYAAGFDSKVQRMIATHQPAVIEHVHTESLTSHIGRRFDMFEGMFEDHGIPTSTLTAKVVANVAAPIDWYMQRVFSAAQRGDNYARTVAFYHKVAKEMDAVPAYRMPLRNAFNLQARHLQVNQALMLDAMEAHHNQFIPGTFKRAFEETPISAKEAEVNKTVSKILEGAAEGKTVDQIAKDLNIHTMRGGKLAVQTILKKAADFKAEFVHDKFDPSHNPDMDFKPPKLPHADPTDRAISRQMFGQVAAEETYAWFGKYDGLTAAQWSGMRKLVPFWLWWMHAYNIAVALPTRAPLRAALMARLLRVQPLVLQPNDMAERYKKMGAIPVYRRNGQRLYDAAGFPQLETGSAWVPITQAFEWQDELAKIQEGNHDQVSFPMLNVAAQTSILAGLTFYDTYYKDPRQTVTKGKHFNEKGELGKNTPLPLQNIPGKILLPGIDKNIREHIAFPNKPSDQTTLFNKVPQQFNGQFVPQSRPNWGILDRLQMMGKQFYKGDTMPEATTQGQEIIQNLYDKRDYMRAAGRHPKAQEK